MNNFYERCLQLRDFYLKTESDNTKINLLGQLWSLAFCNSKNVNDLPRGITCSIYCYNLSGTTTTIENSLKSVLSDLHFQNYHVEVSSYFYVSHEIRFVINDI